MTGSKRGETFVLTSAEAAPQPVTFHSFVLGLAASALIHLGARPHPESGEVHQDLTLARETLDLLALLRDKTRGNLSPEEERLLDSLLVDLRLKFVEAAKA
jgi:hypothetical protein